MDSDQPKIAEGLEGEPVKQFSIFLANRVGALCEVVQMLHEQHVTVLALNVQDSADSAIVRLVASDPERLEDVFHQHNIAFSSTPYIVVELKEGADALGKMLVALLMAEVNIHGCYPLLTRPHGHPALALHVEDNECAAAVLSGHGFRLLTQQDLSR